MFLVLPAVQAQDKNMAKILSAEDRARGHLIIGKLHWHAQNNGYLFGNFFGSGATTYEAADGNRYDASFDMQSGLEIAIPPGAYTPTEALNSISKGYQLVRFQYSTGGFEPLDGSRGALFSDPPAVWGLDSYPMLAHSNLPQTWPPSGYPGPEPIGDQEFYFEFDDSHILDNIAASLADQRYPIGIRASVRGIAYGTPDLDDINYGIVKVFNESGYDLNDIWIGIGGAIQAASTYFYNGGHVFHDIDRQLYWTQYHLEDNNEVKGGGGIEFPWMGLVFLKTPTGDFKTGNLNTVTDFHSGNPFAPDNPADEISNYAIFTTSPDLFLDTTQMDHWINQHNIPGQRIQDDEAYKAYITAHGNWWRPQVHISSGPFNLANGDSVEFIFARVAGVSKDLMLEHADRAIWVYTDKDYQGPKAPDTPTVFEASGEERGVNSELYNPLKHQYKITYTCAHGVVNLYWSDNSEASTDPITGQDDFEGYRIFKSNDMGRTWGKKITNERGDRIGWVPYVTFDKEDYIKGTDPFSSAYLGDDSGLQHMFADSNVVDGYEYWYTIAVYDNGSDSEGNQTQASLQSAMGTHPSQLGVVAVVPGYPSSGVTGGETIGDTLLSQGGFTDGMVVVKVLDPTKLTGHDYKITFSEQVDYLGETSSQTGVNLQDLSSGEFVLKNSPLTDVSAGGDNITVVDGLLIQAMNVASGVKSAEWTVGNTDYQWGDSGTLLMQITTVNDFEVTIDRGANTIARTFDSTEVVLPITVAMFDADDPNTPIDVSSSTLFINHFDPWGALSSFTAIGDGFSLDPGGASYYAPWYYKDAFVLAEFPDFPSDRHPSIILLINNGPATATAPNDGDKFKIITYKPFRESVWYSFSTTSLTTPVAMADMDEIRVVPNPYLVKAVWDPGIIGDFAQYPEAKIQFTHLPENCTIDIYTVAGDKIASLDHNAQWGGQNVGSVDWNLLTQEGVEAASGLFVYVVTASDGRQKTGKFAIIR